MSIEVLIAKQTEAVEANTAALVKLAEALSKQGTAAAKPAKPAKEEKTPEAPKQEPKVETKAPEADPFADDTPPAKPATKDEVRAALVAYQQAKSKELGDDGKGKAAALALMAEKGGGAKTITELFTGGKQQDVYEAIKTSFGDKFEAAVAAAGASLKK